MDITAKINGVIQRGVKSVTVDENGHLMFTLTDEAVLDLGSVEGPKGDTGVGIASIARTSGTGAAGTTDTYTITMTNGSTATFTVYNGKDGAGKVESVNGKTGSVNLTADDVGAVPCQESEGPDGATYELAGHIDMVGHKINRLGDPAAADDAVTKAYVDRKVQEAVGSGAAGEDGGYYAPSVDSGGNLTWTASKAGMPQVSGANIKGPEGPAGADGTPITWQGEWVASNVYAKNDAVSYDGSAWVMTEGPVVGAVPGVDSRWALMARKGADGKSAYQYAVEGGYTGTEAEFAAKMAAEIPEVDDTLTKSGQAADSAVVGNLLSSLSEEKVTMPVDAGGTVQNGISGQILQSNGDGTTQWVEKPTGGSSSGITDINIKKWFGKKIIVDGSSITSGGSGNTLPTWHSFIKDMFALDTVYDHSLSGSNWLYSSSAYPSSYSRLQDYEDDADAVIIMGDFSSSHVNVGTIDDEANVEGDTYYARLKGYADALVAKYPLCPIIWCIEPPRNVGNPSEMSDSRKRAEGITVAIKAVAEYYGFPVADCFHKTIFRQYNEKNYAETTSDGTHPWNNIQRTMAQVIAETMKGTPLFYNESYVVTPPDDTSGDSGGDTTDKTLTKITATTVSGYALYEQDTLDKVKDCIKVTATYSDLSEDAVTDYVVSGELTAGNQTFTITYEGVSTSVVLTVTEGYRSVTITGTDYIDESLLGYYFSSNGAPTSTRDGMFVSTYIAVMPNTTITFSGVKLHGMSNAELVFYDSDHRIISVFDITFVSKTTTVPENAAYFRFCDDTSSTNTITYVPG